MKIEIAAYNPEWPNIFANIRKELQILLREINPIIEHIGSTSVPNLAGKNVIDVMVGVSSIDQLDLAVENILKNDKYIYYKVYNTKMPDRRLFVRLKDNISPEKYQNVFDVIEKIPHNGINQDRLAHIHVWEKDSHDWTRHIAFREYLKTHGNVRQEYEGLKKHLSTQDWEHGMAYNDGKNEFIKAVEEEALIWLASFKQQ